MNFKELNLTIQLLYQQRNKLVVVLVLPQNALNTGRVLEIKNTIQLLECQIRQSLEYLNEKDQIKAESILINYNQAKSKGNAKLTWDKPKRKLQLEMI